MKKIPFMCRDAARLRPFSVKGSFLSLLLIVSAMNSNAAVPQAFAKSVRVHNSPYPFSITLHSSDGDSDQVTFEVVNPPQHGIWFLEPSAQLSIQTIRTNAIRYTPNTGYTGPDHFTFRVRDAVGDLSNIATVALEVLPPVAEPYIPPIGIPKPEFGIEETHRMYEGQIYTYNGNPGPYKDAGNGPYTHFIDNTQGNATDTGNPYGTAAIPRRTLPDWQTIEAGAVIEVHGGPYLMAGQDILYFYGTVEKPIFLRGVGGGANPEITGGANGGEFLLVGHYVIWENLDFNDKSLQARGNVITGTSHIGIRQCNFNLGSVGAVSYYENAQVNNFVIYKITHKGPYFDPNGPEFPEDDDGGIGIGRRTSHVWVLDSDISQGKGDAWGGGHAAAYTASNYYVGRNRLHQTGENAVDIKEVENVIVSQNKMYDITGLSAGSDGTAVVVHYGPTYSPKNVWFLFNEIYNCRDKGIQVGGDQEYPVYFIGNIVRDIHNDAGTARAFATWGCREVFMTGNVFHNIDNGIDWGVQGTAAWLVFNNNIFSSVSSNGFHLRVEATSQQQKAEINNNIFFQPGGGARFIWGGMTYNTLAQWQAASGKGQGSLEADPRFVNPAAFDFHLQSASPAIDKTGEESIYQLFQETFGIGIRYDADGNARPQGSAWDIGAYEYSPSGTDTQTIQLQPGWNWISFNIFPSNRSLDDIFGGIIGQVEQVRTQTQSALRLNGNWVGDLLNMDGIQAGKMYKVRLNAACTLTVTGTQITSNTPIQLVAGWNWIAFYPADPQVISAALSSIAGQAQQAKSQIQSAIYQSGSWLGDLTQMEPGKGYTVLMSGPGALIYPER